MENTCFALAHFDNHYSREKDGKTAHARFDVGVLKRPPA